MNLNDKEYTALVSAINEILIPRLKAASPACDGQDVHHDIEQIVDLVPRLIDDIVTRRAGNSPTGDGLVLALAMELDEARGQLASARRKLAEAEQRVAELTGRSLETMHALAVQHTANYYDAASREETNWSGWGDMEAPPHVEMRRVKAGQAVAALRDAGPRR